MVKSVQKINLQTVNSFSSMIPSCWRNTIYGWMSSKGRLLQLWTLLRWRSWTRWVCCVSCSERKVSNFINWSVFLNGCIDFSVGCRSSTGGWSIVIWPSDSVRSSPKQKFSKYCGRLSTIPGKTMTKSWWVQRTLFCVLLSKPVFYCFQMKKKKNQEESTNFFSPNDAFRR